MPGNYDCSEKLISFLFKFYRQNKEKRIKIFFFLTKDFVYISVGLKVDHNFGFRVSFILASNCSIFAKSEVPFEGLLLYFL